MKSGASVLYVGISFSMYTYYLRSRMSQYTLPLSPPSPSDQNLSPSAMLPLRVHNELLPCPAYAHWYSVFMDCATLKICLLGVRLGVKGGAYQKPPYHT